MALAVALSVEVGCKTSTEIIREFFAVREGTDGWTSRDTERHVVQSLHLPDRLRGEVTGWLNSLTNQHIFLDVGCGLGGLLIAAGAAGKTGIGIDNRLSVIVAAKRLIEAAGGTATLACANAESLPLRDGSVGGVVMYDVVEHVEGLGRALSEASRVTMTNGLFACSTPNRFSLAPEPHVRLWGVGWLPRKYQSRYVRMRIDWDYSGTQLLSPSELVRLLRKRTAFSVRLSVPLIPDRDIEKGTVARRRLGGWYNLAARRAILRPLLLLIGPFFRLEGVKRAPFRD